MVATSNPLAVEAALWALGEGGSAMDAALASDAVLGVVQPMSTGVGGDIFCLVDDGHEVTAFNGSGAAPAAIATDDWHDRSPFTVTVPGVVDGWAQLSERYGRLGLDRVLEPAIGLARHGFPLGATASLTWRAESKRWSGSPPLPAHPPAGARITNPALADTLVAIATGGRDAHYQGEFGEAAAGAVGHMTLDDLAGHRGEWVDPISTTYRGHEVVELPPNGQGAAVLVALNELEDAPLGPAGDPETVDRTMQAVRRGMETAYAQVADPRRSAVEPFWEARDTVYTAVVADG
ncbi:MAG: gamma-glutamyltransferase, partial [Acidimicrobiia bacterium]|nr:gamma-glutamyltransferase [Acidimicrobiia bacterium]